MGTSDPAHSEMTSVMGHGELGGVAKLDGGGDLMALVAEQWCLQLKMKRLVKLELGTLDESDSLPSDGVISVRKMNDSFFSF